ncbi:AMP-binding protein [Paraglaciecola sp. 20A4]|uniref:AMP-binding protein n=1 Tax=Paraglaciecola sp. 20A4 TaxID=2687288 RepID=UPI0014094769|nr:AMP-binding protein [Paraglaciecola sp. 20A4]
MSNLASLLINRAVTPVIESASQSFSVEWLLELAQQWREEYQHLKNKPLALIYTDSASFSVGLLAFDGFCSDLYLCSASLVKSIDPSYQRLSINIYPASEQHIKLSQEDAEIAQKSSFRVDHAFTHTIVTRWWLASSGTSGQPKWFSHSLASLTLSTKASPTLSALCWANLYQPYRYAGLQVLLQALTSGATLVDGSSEDLITNMKHFAREKVSALSATPSMWRQMLMTNQLLNLPLKRITLGGETVDQPLLDKLSALYPDASIRHIYASTEAGVGFVVADKLAGFPVDWLQQGVGRAQLRIDENQHLRIKPSHKLDAQLEALIDEKGYLDTQDQVQIEGERVLFLGRASGVINVGGNKVHPEKVESIILSVAGVLQAKVYGQANSVLGSLVVADIVIDSHHDWSSISHSVRERCKLILQRFEIPVKLRHIDSLVVSPTGKLNRSDNV